MIKIFNTEEDASEAIACEIHSWLKDRAYPLFCLAAGSTPRKSYEKFIEKCQMDDCIKKARFIGLDEWVGVGRFVKGSCYQMLYEDLFRHLPLDESQIEFFNTLHTDLNEECKKADDILKTNKLTFSLMGVGMNGHIGLNEPGSPVSDHSSVVLLSETTKKVAKKYFQEDVLLKEGITLGLKQIIDSERVIVVMLGSHKAEIAKKIFEDKKARLPAQALLGYDHIDFFLDKESASQIPDDIVQEFIK